MYEIGRGDAWTALEQQGDLIEQFAVRTLSLASAVGSYAALWANHVLPARQLDDPAFVLGPLKDLAELSYSALVRLLAASAASSRVSQACESMLAESTDVAANILVVQEALFSFFCNAGAAVDLINKARETVNAVIFTDDDCWGSGGWFYDRRSGYIHERLAPVFAVDGLLHIDTDLLTQKRANWSDSVASTTELSGLIDDLMKALTGTLDSGWERLHQAVRKVEPPRVAEPGIAHQQFTSASPRWPVV